ncbi:pectinesterase family protein [Xylariales sp. AK1849]|nr:pectinesterase family protein [Xylariales sp. AK1849]
MILPSLAVLAALLPLVAAAAPYYSNTTGPLPAKTYAECQRKTCDPLQGCPRGTIYVSKDSSRADFTTIQGAIASLPDDSSGHIILIAPGNYTEQLNVTRPGPLTLLGVSDDPYRGASYGAVSSDTDHANGVQVLWASANTDNTGKVTDNAITTVLTVAPTWNASLTGSGPTGFAVPAGTPLGSSDFRAYNIDFRNIYSLQAAGPALAVNVAYANASFYGSGFYSYQDTVYIGKLGNAYFYDNVIAGQTDFLYGFGTAWIEKSTLALRNCGGGITAWKGTNTTFTNKYGVYIASSRVISANESIAATIEGKCALGRPWNALHRSIFMESYLDESILPAGYIIWAATDVRFSNTTFMAVYDDYGPGYDQAAIAASNVSIVLDAEEVKPYSAPVDVFITPDGEGGSVNWIDGNVYHH